MMYQTQAGMTADGTPLGASHTLCLMPGSTLLVELCSPAAVYSWVLCGILFPGSQGILFHLYSQTSYNPYFQMRKLKLKRNNFPKVTGLADC